MTERMKIRNASQSVSKEDLRQLLLAVLEGADDVEKPKETPIEHGEDQRDNGGLLRDPADPNRRKSFRLCAVVCQLFL